MDADEVSGKELLVGIEMRRRAGRWFRAIRVKFWRTRVQTGTRQRDIAFRQLGALLKSSYKGRKEGGVMKTCWMPGARHFQGQRWNLGIQNSKRETSQRQIPTGEEDEHRYYSRRA